MRKKIIGFFVCMLMLAGVFVPVATTISIQHEAPQIMSDTLFNRHIQMLMRFAHKPSLAACIIFNDKVVWSHAYGYYDIESKKEATTHTLYLQASISKTITATALMQLYEKGLFNLDDDVNKYLPFSLRNQYHPDIPITIRMILSHHSSLADDNLHWVALSYLPGDPDTEGFPYPWLKEYLTPGGSAYSSSTWSLAKPGEKYYYANIGYSIIGYLVEILSHQNFDDYCKEHIFTPLQMNATGFRLRDCNINTIAVPYEYKNGAYFRHPQYGMDVLYPAMSLRTSIEEYSHFIIANMNGGVWNGVRILNASTVELMHTAQFSPDDKNNYGIGWQLINTPFKKIYSHGGAMVGIYNLVRVTPNDNTALILFSNACNPEITSTLIERKAFIAIFDALYFKAKMITS